MEAYEAIVTRRSIRKYTSEPVSDDVVKQLMDAAMAAPSAGNEQPWQFVVIRDRAVLDALPTVHPNFRHAQAAPMAVLVCGDLEKEAHQAFWVQDCTAATQNVLLAAHALGLGAVWMGIYPREERLPGLRKLLGLPEHVVPLALLAVGHPAESKPRAERYDASRVHYDRW